VRTRLPPFIDPFYSVFLQGKVDSFMDTPGPLSICITNMVIVFAVLIFLAFVIQLIHIVDPTKGKKK
jgi:hypothetical protein